MVQDPLIMSNDCGTVKMNREVAMKQETVEL